MDVDTHFPDEVGWVLDLYGGIWANDGKSKDQGDDDTQRLAYHQAHSIPIMESIKEEKAALLLEPVAKAVLNSILQSALLAMDETPSKAGRTKKIGAKHGTMRQGWYWPLYGDRDEIYFHFSPSRGAEVVHRLLDSFNGTLLSDGYSAYTSYIKQTESVTHALCWVHSRRYFEGALEDVPELANHALDLIGGYQPRAVPIPVKEPPGHSRRWRDSCAVH